ncbi:MAG TPA: SOS response-associated peptidase [Pseudorhodoplanes sp.]|jgi:putative SOS response-associated peptidase YedK|nr:SOS response-associated peptidase [Pseudorhodoplanes sp.]
MCGRYSITTAPEAMRRLFRYAEQPNFPPRYNVAPTQPIPIVRLAEGRRQFALVRWGLLPAWVKDPAAFTLLINARGESVNDKPAFRNAMKYRRCLIPADGFYEWKRDGRHKRPFFIRRADGAPFAFAGLWETWTGPNGEEMESAAIVTTDASPSISHIHHRMPVMLDPDQFEMWLDCRTVDAHAAASLFRPRPDGDLAAQEISDRVNRVANDSADIQAPLTAQERAEREMEGAAAKPRRKARPDDGQSSLF